MAKSSYAVALILAGWSAEASADPPAILPVTFDVATADSGPKPGGPPGAGCPDAGRGSDEEIVVCGRTPYRQLYRLPLPIVREPGEIVRHVNEPGSGVEAMAGAICTHSCYQPVTINVIKAARAMPKIIRHIFGGDD